MGSEVVVMVAHFCWLRPHAADDTSSSASEQSTPSNFLHASGTEVGMISGVVVIMVHCLWLSTHTVDICACLISSQSTPRNFLHSSGAEVRVLGAVDVSTGVLLLCEWSVISIVEKDVKVGEAFGLAVEGLIERVNTLDVVIGLNVKSGTEVVVALADEGVDGDYGIVMFVVVQLADVELSPSSSSSSFSRIENAPAELAVVEVMVVPSTLQPTDPQMS